MADEKTQVKIIVYLNSKYCSCSLPQYTRQILQELRDMGAEQVFIGSQGLATITISLDIVLDGGTCIAVNHSVSFKELCSRKPEECSVVEVVLHSLTNKCGNLVWNGVNDALEELRKPEIVQVPTGVTYEGYPVTLRITNRGQALTDDIARAKTVAMGLQFSTVALANNSTWTLSEGATPAKLRTKRSATVEHLTTAYSTGTYYGGFLVCLMACSGSMLAEPSCRQMQQALEYSLNKWGLISD